MGCIASKQAPYVSEKAEILRSQVIDKQIQEERVQIKKEVKMLLLGAAESGKSTILKQMVLIHGPGYSYAERSSYRDILIYCLMQSVVAVIDAIESPLNLQYENPENAQNAANVKAFRQDTLVAFIPDKMIDAIKSLLRDATFTVAVMKAAHYQLSDSAKYYFENIDRFTQVGYVPTDQDILRSRVRTTSIVETMFNINNVKFRMFDVGGQRSERKKWIHCFENVTAIVFMAAISEYDQVLTEDGTTNRVKESLDLFSGVCNARWFADTSMILFLNKIDVLKEKLKTSPIKNTYPDFTGGDSYVDATKYFTRMFQAQNKRQGKVVYVHLTCATDTTQIKFVMTAVRDIVTRSNLSDAGFI